MFVIPMSSKEMLLRNDEIYGPLSIHRHAEGAIAVLMLNKGALHNVQ
jgi:hypothetical protein